MLLTHPLTSLTIPYSISKKLGTHTVMDHIYLTGVQNVIISLDQINNYVIISLTLPHGNECSLHIQLY